MLLPIVTEEVGLALQRELLGEEFNLVAVLQEIQEENPCIVNFISNFAVQTGSPEEVVWCGMAVYLLLKKQSEAERNGFQSFLLPSGASA